MQGYHPRSMVQTADGMGEATVVRRAGESSRSWPKLAMVDWVLVGIVVLAAVLRFWRIGEPSVWYDEYITTDHLHQSFAHMVTVAVPQVEGTPPLSLALGWYWARIFSFGDGTLRALYALEGIALVPVAYALARELRLTRRIARVVALLVATNPLLVWYSQEARPYALLALLGTVSLFCCVRAINDDRTSNFVLWGMAAAAALCTHYFAILLIVPEAVWLGIVYREQLRKVLLGCVPLAVVALPLAWLAFRQQGENQEWIRDFPIGQRLAEAGRSYMLGPAQPWEPWWPLLAAVVVATVVSVIVLGDARERSTALIMAVLGTVGFALALVASAAGVDYFLGRNLIVSLVPFAVIIAIGLGTSRVGWFGVVAAVLISVGWVAVVVEVGTSADLQKANWRAVGELVEDGPRHRVVLVDGYLGAPLLRYVEDSRALRKRKLVNIRALDLVYRIPEPGRHCGRWSGLGCEAFFFPRLPKSVERRFALVDRVEFDGFVVNRYESPTPVTVSNRRLLEKRNERRSFLLLPDEDLRTYRPDRDDRDDRDVRRGR